MERAHPRFDELDSLRGLAAMAVFFEHASGCLGIENTDTAFRNNPLVFLVVHSPLHAFWGGHEAVILFFVLSGFVLSLPWLRGEPVNYTAFAYKRICRIWIPYIVAAIAALSLRATLYTKHLPGMSSFFYNAWTGHLTATKLMNIASLVGYFGAEIFDLATWSLVHEMRISLAFPLIMLAVGLRSWKHVLAGAFFLSLAAGAIRKITHPALSTDGWHTIHYAAFFVIGYLLAANMSRIRTALPSGPLVFGAGVCVYTYSYWFFPRVLALHLPHINDWFIAVGSALLIVAALSGGAFPQILRHSSTVWLGRVSYSLYLYHAPVMLSLIYAFSDVMQPVWSVVLALPVTLVVSAAAYRWVELPAIGLARRHAGRVIAYPKIPTY